MHPQARIVVCAGSGRSRSSIVQRLAAQGVPTERYATIIDPTVVVGPGTTVGEGSILLTNAVLTADVSVGAHVVLMPNVTLTHDVMVEDFATLCAGVAVGGNTRIGRAAYVGMNSSVKEGVVVGKFSVLGMGAALVRDLPDNSMWAGVPAGPIRHRTPSIPDDAATTLPASRPSPHICQEGPDSPPANAAVAVSPGSGAGGRS